MIIRDFYCEVCGCTKVDVITDSVKETTKYMHCKKCDEKQSHRACCNGGLGKRYRCNDFPTDVRRYRGHVTHTVEGFENCDEDNLIPGKDKEGNIIHEKPKFSEETRAERMDKIYHETDRDRGYAPLFMDMKKQTAN